jgi:hypothetical protein
MMQLDPQNVPDALVPLLPMAARWGIGDDYERDCLVETASSSEIAALIKCADPYEAELFAWLEGPDAKAANPSAEYVAMTNLTLAIEYAKALEKR